MPDPGDLGGLGLNPEPAPAFVKPTKCRVVLFYPWNYAGNEHAEPLPAIVTRVGDDWVSLVVFDANHGGTGTYPAEFIRHKSVPQGKDFSTGGSRERWDWPPRS